MNNLSYEEKEILYRKIGVKKKSEFRVNWLDHKISDLATWKTALIVDIPPYYTELTWMKVKFEDVFELVILTKSIWVEEKDRWFLYEGYYAGNYNKKWFGENKLHKNGTKYDDDGFDFNGFNKDWFDVEWYDDRWYDVNGYNKDNFNKRGLDPQWFDAQWINNKWFNKLWVHMNGTEFDDFWYDSDWFNKNWFKKFWMHKNGTEFDNEWFNIRCFNGEKVHKNGTEFDDNWLDYYWYDSDWFDGLGFNRNGHDRNGYSNANSELASGTDISINNVEEETGFEKIEEDEEDCIYHNENEIEVCPPVESDFSVSNELNETPIALCCGEYDELWQELLNNERKRNNEKEQEENPSVEEFDGGGFQYFRYLDGHIYPTWLHKNGTYFDENGLAYGGTVFSEHGYDKDDYDAGGFSLQWHVKEDGEYYPFEPLHKNGTEFDNEWFNKRGFDSEWFNKKWFHKKTRLDRNGFDEMGFDKSWLHKNGTPYNEYGFDSHGIQKDWTTRDNDGYDFEGLDKDLYNRRGFKAVSIFSDWRSQKPLHKNGTEYDCQGYDAEWFDRWWYDFQWFNKRGFRKNGIHKNYTNHDDLWFDSDGYNPQWFQDSWLHKNGTMYDEDWYDALGKRRVGNRVEEIGYDEFPPEPPF